MKTIRSKRSITVAVIVVLTLLFSMMMSITSADALSTGNATGKVNGRGAVLRKTASPFGKKITVLKNNTTLTISQEVFSSKTSTSAKNRWYYVKAGGKTGYIRSDQVKTIRYKIVKGKVTSAVKYRSGAGSAMPSKGSLKKNATIEVLLTAKAKGSGTTWYKFRIGSKCYYVSSKWVKLTGYKTPVKPSFKVSELRYPTKLTEGSKFTIKGKVTSNVNMSKAVVQVRNKAGKAVISKTLTVNSKNFSILKADKYITFGKLSPGSYTYVVSVYVNGKAYNQVKKTFTVAKKPAPAAPKPQTSAGKTTAAAAETQTSQPVSAGDGSVTIKDVRAPQTLYEGGAFTVKGIIQSSAAISKVVIGAVNSSGSWQISVSKNVNANTFDVLTADKDLRFGTLPVGSYTYRVIATVNGKDCTLVNQAFSVKKAAKAERITNKAFELAWPAGTSSSKYSYGDGSPTAAYRLALESAYPNRGSWGEAPRVGASCDVFVGTVLRASGVDPSAPRGLSEQFPYYKSKGLYTKVNYTGSRSQLRSGDIIMFTRKAGNTHTCIYLKKNGKEYIAEANYTHTYGMIVSGSGTIDSKLTLSDKKEMLVYRIKE